MTFEQLQAGELAIEPVLDTGGVRLVWRGRSDTRDPRTVLNPYFQQVFAAAHLCGGRVEMDFGSLEYFNSSTIASLIDAIRLAREHRVSMVMTYKQSVRWQRMSFDALRVFTRDHDFELRPV
jgi:hypothetical protein